MKAVVLGGYGHFGRIISGKLVGDGICEVVVAGRNESAAREFASGIGARWAAIDADAADLARRIAGERATLVISTAGPFQDQDYRVARAALEAGAHYIDIADARRFVCGITALDREAKRQDRIAVAGASSVPALSAAVVDAHAPHFSVLESIDIGISTTQRPPGIATTRAVLGYCGKRIPAWRGGAACEAFGWQGLRRHRFNGPAGTRWIADCDVPDLELFPARYAGLRDMRFGAGVELAPVQMGLWMLAAAVRMRLLPSSSGWAGGLHRLSGALSPLGSGRSAMFVAMQGRDESGAPMTRRWQLSAAAHQGARIPAMAAVALARRLARGELQVRGAMPCVGLITLDQYLAELGGLPIEVESV